MDKVEKVREQVVILPDAYGVLPDIPEEVLYKQMVEAGWTGSPLDGKAILLPDGRELVHPTPVAPPLGYVAGPSLMDTINAMLTQRLLQLKDNDQLEDSLEDANDFDEPEVFDPRSDYELIMTDEFPGIPKGGDKSASKESSEVAGAKGDPPQDGAKDDAPTT